MTIVSASDAAAAATLVLASTARVRSEDPKPWFEEVLYSAGDAMGPTSRWSRRRHILDRLLSVGKARSYADLSKLLGDQASGCGRDRDLVGYLVLVSIAAATEDAAGRRAGAESLLQNVAERLASQQQEEACGVLQTHIDALRGC